MSVCTMYGLRAKDYLILSCRNDGDVIFHPKSKPDVADDFFDFFRTYLHRISYYASRHSPFVDPDGARDVSGGQEKTNARIRNSVKISTPGRTYERGAGETVDRGEVAVRRFRLSTSPLSATGTCWAARRVTRVWYFVFISIIIFRSRYRAYPPPKRLRS